MMEIPAGKYCDEPTTECGPFTDCKKEPVVCVFFYDACPFPEDQTEEPVVVRQSIEEGFVDAFERCSACLSAYPNGATVAITPKEVPCK
jgi:hypothetical protein